MEILQYLWKWLLSVNCFEQWSVNLTLLCVSGKQGQCVYQGMTMFDQAVWSPKPCVTCLCTGGRAVCDEVACPKLHCHFPFTPVGGCCPVCMEPGKNTTCDKAMVRHPEATEMWANVWGLYLFNSTSGRLKGDLLHTFHKGSQFKNGLSLLKQDFWPPLSL